MIYPGQPIEISEQMRNSGLKSEGDKKPRKSHNKHKMRRGWPDSVFWTEWQQTGQDRRLYSPLLARQNERLERLRRLGLVRRLRGKEERYLLAQLVRVFLNNQLSLICLLLQQAAGGTTNRTAGQSQTLSPPARLNDRRVLPQQPPARQPVQQQPSRTTGSSVAQPAQPAPLGLNQHRVLRQQTPARQPAPQQPARTTGAQSTTQQGRTTGLSTNQPGRPPPARLADRSLLPQQRPNTRIPVPQPQPARQAGQSSSSARPVPVTAPLRLADRRLLNRQQQQQQQ
ncbi:hypothetical protein QBC35DRAFT_461689, partial [Podospora australis]